MRLIALILVIFSGCTSQRPLLLTTEYLTPDKLASAFVGSPDPERIFPCIGEQLNISWKLNHPPKDHTLEVTIRFHDQTEKKLELTINKKKGRVCYQLLNADYFAVCGIQTYHATLYGPEGVEATFKHPMWVERIEIYSDDEETNFLEAR